MTTITIPKKEYENITQRQIILERELAFLKRVILETEESFIRPAVLRRWERISRALDRGSGRSFSSIKEMRRWLKEL